MGLSRGVIKRLSAFGKKFTPWFDHKKKIADWGPFPDANTPLSWTDFTQRFFSGFLPEEVANGRTNTINTYLFSRRYVVIARITTLNPEITMTTPVKTDLAVWRYGIISRLLHRNEAEEAWKTNSIGSPSNLFANRTGRFFPGDHPQMAVPLSAWRIARAGGCAKKDLTAGRQCCSKNT